MKKVQGKEVHYVEFLSPGTFISETTEKKIASWDTKKACAVAKKVVERHMATPYGFRFVTKLVADPVSVNGEKLEVKSKVIKVSGIYFITGTIRTAAQVLKGSDPEENILRSNVRCNGYPAIIENNNSYKSTMPFGKDDFLVDWDGTIKQKGLAGLV